MIRKIRRRLRLKKVPLNKIKRQMSQMRKIIIKKPPLRTTKCHQQNQKLQRQMVLCKAKERKRRKAKLR
tara:strand:- start:717 stop:923 length:207 start_codon:yes stop_codon:yes gene_type:complete